MIVLTLNNITNLNVSLQVGDLIYSKYAQVFGGAEDARGSNGGNLARRVDSSDKIGTLTNISVLGGGVVELTVDNIPGVNGVPDGKFIMFSKHDQTMGDVIGYYAIARFVNNSREKAEIFSVGSEVTLNSK